MTRPILVLSVCVLAGCATTGTAGFQGDFQASRIGPSKRTQRSIVIRCSLDHPGLDGAIDARAFLHSQL